jgi:hypothetical protein
MRKYVFLLLISALIAGCAAEKNPSKYLRWVGDIEYDPELDDPAFEICFSENAVKQYFNFSQGIQYEGEMLEIREVFEKNYQPIAVDQSGFIRVRFIVNCKAQTGRFRLISSNENYEPFEFDKRISDQILEITKSLNGWKPLPNNQEAEDYYQYLAFKIESGRIIEVLP